MHGEYKTPGGKLVIVDFAVRDGQLAAMEVSGDFFLYPDDALDTITHALNGLPTSLPADEIAAQIRHTVGPDVVFLGFSPEAIGIAIQRAMSDHAAGSGQRAAGDEDD
jgi:lipoate-protein ligase A